MFFKLNALPPNSMLPGLYNSGRMYPFLRDRNINRGLKLKKKYSLIIGHTALMKNDIYYDTYCIAINTIFASLFPFIALMFFNVRIALKLNYGRKVRGHL